MVYIRIKKSRKRIVMDKIREVLLSREFTATTVAFTSSVLIFAVLFARKMDVIGCGFTAFLGWVLSWMAYMALTEQ